MSGTLENRPQQNDTILGHVGIATSVEGNKLDLVRLGGKYDPRGGPQSKRTLPEAAGTEIGKSILVPNLRALDYWGCPLFIYGDRFSFLLIEPLQSLDQRTGLSGEEIFPSLCPLF